MLDTRDKPDQADALRDADECYRCGYALVGIADEQPCPECGLLAIRSRRISDELHNTRPRWLRRISWGVWLMLIAIFVAFAWPFAIDRVETWMYQRFSLWMKSTWGPTIYLELYFLGLHLGGLLLIIAAVLLTTPEQYPPADRVDRWRRWLIRALAPVPLIGLIVTNAMMGSGWNLRLPRVSMLAEVGGIVVAALGGAALALLIFLQLRSLAKRARSAHLAEHCAIVGIGAAASLVYIAVITCIFATQQTDEWASKSDVALVLILMSGVSGLLFMLWSLYLLTRFAIAFGKASRQLRRQWKEADRAQSPGC